MALLTSATFANPIATPPVKEATVKKTWDRCVISVGPNSATVSCAVGYSASQFLVGHVPDKAFSIVVSYEQPAIKGCIYYLPLFEGGISPTIADDFDVTFFPTKGGALSLKSEHRPK